jgi:hypothetical protein
MTCIGSSAYWRTRQAYCSDLQEIIAHRLHGWTAWTAACSEVSCGLHKIRSTNALALVLVVFPQQEVAIALQRIIDATSNLSIVQKQRAICTATGRTVGLVLGRVTGCARLISSGVTAHWNSRGHSPASWKANLIASAARRVHPKKFDFKSAAMSNQTCGHDPLAAGVAGCSNADLLWDMSDGVLEFASVDCQW